MHPHLSPSTLLSCTQVVDGLSPCKAYYDNAAEETLVTVLLPGEVCLLLSP